MGTLETEVASTGPLAALGSGTGWDVIDVSGINFNAPNFTESYNAATHRFTMSDGTQTASFYLDYFGNALNFGGDVL